jgi:hypothetical protein
MADDVSQLNRDPDLERWARELGVAYEELLSTLNYAGPTFKDLGRSSDLQRPAGNGSAGTTLLR